jgi:NADH:ubiquinone reductase (H+-translocating)
MDSFTIGEVHAPWEPEPFWYWDKGDLAIVGRTYAVADLRFAKFAGFPAWVLWVVVHIYFLIGFANRLFVLLQWGFDFLTKRRGVFRKMNV